MEHQQGHPDLLPMSTQCDNKILNSIKERKFFLMSYFPKPSLNENDLAIIERGGTAAHSIEAGQYVSWHGRTGKAKAAILQGATLDDTLFDYDEDGVLNASKSQLIWENPSPSSGYSGTDLVTTDRDIVIVLCYGNTSLVSYGPHIMIPIVKGKQGFYTDGTNYVTIKFESNGRIWVNGRTSITGVYPAQVIGL